MVANVKSAFFKLGQTDSPVGKVIRESAGSFASFDEARKDEIDISPKLRQAIVEAGVHEDRVREYVDDLMNMKTPTPKVSDFLQPKVIPFPK